VPAELRDQSPKASLLETQSPFLSRPLDSWFDLIAMNVVLDEAVRVAVEAARDSRFLPLRQRVDKILQEEQYHRTFGAGWLAQLRGQGEAGRRRLREATDAMTAAGRDWFAYLADETDFDDLLSAAVLASSPDQQQQEWQNRMHASLGSLHH
jgi:ring-1,2-phenylacetyl-CoA epoxidase subunit PaaC